MELTIELVGRGSRHFDLQHVSGEQITIGRGFDNDIVLSDPHVCARHAVIESNESGEILLKDLDSVNGTFTKKHQAVGKGCAVTSGDEFIIGKTRIRIYQRDHAVTPSIRLTWVEKLAHLASKPLLTGTIFLFAVLMSVFFQYANEIKTFHLGRELITAVGILLLISVWPASWTLFARAKKHDARFMAQLSATIVFIILITLIQKIVTWLAFHFGTSLGLDLFSSGLYILLTLLLVWLNYYLAVFQTSRKRWIYSVSLTVLLTSFAYVASTFDTDRFKSRPEYSATLYPTSLTVYSSQSVDEYLEKAEGVFDEAMEMADGNK